MRVLIVDDDPLAGEMAAALLEDAGHKCLHADHGLEALELLTSGTAVVDLVVSDMHMPLLSGLELFQELRDQGLNVPFVLLTGDDPEPLRLRAPDIVACLMKDGSLEDVLPRLLQEL